MRVAETATCSGMAALCISDGSSPCVGYMMSEQQHRIALACTGALSVCVRTCVESLCRHHIILLFCRCTKAGSVAQPVDVAPENVRWGHVAYTYVYVRTYT